jgi:ubiquinone/menaquinone biosynthesis C-methylase UbiE
MSQDFYAGIAERYDLFHGEFGKFDTVITDFFRHLFAEHRVESVLDCACGTGRHLPLFHSLGCEVIGSDISSAMLARAEQNLAEYDVDVSLHKVDYRELPAYFDRQFDAVMCLSSSILHMPNEAEVLRALESMHAVLRRGGILVLTQGTTDKQWREKPRFILALNDRDFTRLFVIDYLGRGARYNILDIHHTDEARDLEVWSVEYSRVYLMDDQERLLKASGFKVVDFYGSYDFEPYDKQSSNRLIAVAQT